MRPAGKDYCWFAAGDDNVQDLDLEVTNSIGVSVAKDVRGDPAASVKFTVPRNGEYTVRLSLFKATGTSFCATVFMEEDGWAIPFNNLGVATTRFVMAAGVAAMEVDKLSGGELAVRLPNGSSGWCLFGTVMSQNQSRTITRLSLGEGMHVFLAAGCSRARDIDLIVADQAERVIVRDVQLDATPMGIAPTDAQSLYDVTTSLPASRGRALTMTGDSEGRRGQGGRDPPGDEPLVGGTPVKGLIPLESTRQRASFSAHSPPSALKRELQQTPSPAEISTPAGRR